MSRDSDADPPCTIIAEAGVNHNGSLERAFRLVDAAAEAGADYVKFQTFKADKVVSSEARMARYQAENLGESPGSTQYEMIRKLELSPARHRELQARCRERGIRFLSTPFDAESMELLVELGVDLLKIPSGELTNKPYLEQAAGCGLPVVLSTGMGTLEEVAAALDLLTGGGVAKKNITVLHCTTEYPAPFADVNLRAMNTMAREFGVPVGYSDHTLGIEVPVAAVALGARIIEKHFTLDRSLPGPDHKASLEPGELARMVEAVRHVEQALGNGVKEPAESEKDNIPVARRSIHLAREIPAGTEIGREHLVMLRPGDGISPMKVDEVAGRRCARALEKGHKLTWEDLQ